MQRLHRRGVPDDRPGPDSRSAVNKSLTPKRPRRVVENDEYAAFLRRVIRAYSRRVAAGDIDAITDMAATRRRDGHRHARRHHRPARQHRLQLGRHRPARSASPARPPSSAGAVNPDEHTRPDRAEDHHPDHHPAAHRRHGRSRVLHPRPRLDHAQRPRRNRRLVRLGQRRHLRTHPHRRRTGDPPPQTRTTGPSPTR